jgi:hypothetical protein
MLEPLLLSTVLIASAVFGWEPTGRVITVAGYPNGSLGASDGSAGALVGWLYNSRDFAAQRITASGVPAPGWPAGGRIVAGTSFSEYPAGAAAGAVGDGFFLWIRISPGTYNDLYLAHFDAAGTLDPRWPTDGLGVAVGPPQINSAIMVPDGTGGVLVS